MVPGLLFAFAATLAVARAMAYIRSEVKSCWRCAPDCLLGMPLAMPFIGGYGCR